MKKDGQYVGIQDEYVPEDEKYVDNIKFKKINDNKALNKYEKIISIKKALQILF